MPMKVTVAGCKGFWIPGLTRNDGLEEEGHIKSEQLRVEGVRQVLAEGGIGGIGGERGRMW